jgi:hypothetical protein
VFCGLRGIRLEHCTARLTTEVRRPAQIRPRPDRERHPLAASLPRWDGLRPERNELVARQARPRPVGRARSRRPDAGPVRSSRYSRHGHLRSAFLSPGPQPRGRAAASTSTAFTGLRVHLRVDGPGRTSMATKGEANVYRYRNDSACRDYRAGYSHAASIIGLAAPASAKTTIMITAA